jgi:UDP-N-acetylmuramoylalanine--D-glutamate ligase
VVKSPGVPQEAPVVAGARRRGTRVVGELEIGWRLLANDFVAITGSNGKTTTTELIGHIHREAGASVVVAGNVGTALTTLPGAIERSAVVICEASSFQLEDTEAFAPEAAVLLNLAEDHLDRHGSFDAYRAAKLRVFAAQSEQAIAVTRTDLVDQVTGAAARVTFGHNGDLEHRDGRLYWRGHLVMDASEIRLRGAHNRENAMATAAVCLARGLPHAAVREGLATFTGVPHRMEEIARIDGVLYVNDSKATNVAAALRALAAYADEPVHLILGGSPKGEDFGPLKAAIGPNVRSVHLIGAEAGRLGRFILGYRDGTLENAVAHATVLARPGDVVLLSPACASFDQFENYERRGEAFRDLVAAL